MGKLSVVISAFSEEKKIKDCLESVRQLADEIIFVDNSSTDKTLQIAKEYTPKVFTKPNNPMLNINKNFGFTKATGEWILSLDADERVTPELREEIKKTLLNRHSGLSRIDSGVADAPQNDKNGINGYYIPRKNIIFGKWVRHTGWYPDHQLRLFKKGKGKFPEVHVHEMIEVLGKTDYLINPLEHLNYENISRFLVKLTNIYTPNEAQVLIRNGYQFNWADAIRMPTREFVNRFFAQKGYQDGLHGLVLSLLMAFYHLVVFVKLWEEKNFTQVDGKEFLGTVAKEAKNLRKDSRFWYITSRIQETKNPLEKMILRIQRKFL